LVTMDLVKNASSADDSSSRDESLHKTLLHEYQQQTRQQAIVSFQSCLQEETDSVRSNLTVCTAGDVGYEDLRGTWNKRNAGKQYPHAVVQPSSTVQVSKVIQCAKRTGYHVCGRNGRHSYDGSTCANGIVVDVSKLKTVELVDAERGVVRLGAGQTLGQVVMALEKHGWALPAGTCSSVGVTGLTLNGGQGPLSRLQGLTSDHLVSVELVDEKGHIVRATATNEFSDYLWLARGGGAVGYHYPGIITCLEFAKLVRISRNETNWTRVRIRYTPATVHHATTLLSAWQNFFQDKACQLDPVCNRITAEPWLFMEYQRRNKAYESALRLVVYFFGNEEQHRIFIAQYLPKFQGLVPGGTVVSIEREDQLEFHRKVGGLRTVDQLSVPFLGHDVNTSWFGLSAVAGAPLVPQETFRSIAESIFLREPRYRRYAEFKPLGGAISNVATDDSAFWHRKAHWWVLMNHFFDTGGYNSSNLENDILDDFDGSVATMGDSFQGQYAGYVRHSNSTARDLELYYGGHADRIREIKRARDPHNLFRNYLRNV
jgi:FAD/FMN-containing dehydrogenase